MKNDLIKQNSNLFAIVKNLSSKLQDIHNDLTKITRNYSKIYEAKKDEMNKAFYDAIVDLSDNKIVPVICLDEWDTLFKEDNRQEFNKYFFRNIKSLINDSYLILVVVSEKALYRYFFQRQLVEDFSHSFNFIHLTKLTHKEADKLVKLPKDGPPVLGERYQKIALKWGKQHPLLLQLAASCIYDFYKPEKTTRQIIREAKARFENLAPHFFPHKIINWQRGLFTVIGWLFKDFLIKLGNMPKAMGMTFNEFSNWILGLMILIVILLLLFSLVALPEESQRLQDLIEKLIK